MNRGAQAAADALGVELVFQGAPNFNPVDAGPRARCRDRAPA
jgi:ribose transport system substrate-binding protein